MRTININFTVNEREWELLCMGKCEKPSPERVKVQLLQAAARNLRNLSEEVMRDLHSRPTMRVPKKARLAAQLAPMERQALKHRGKPLTLSEIENENTRKLERINRRAAERKASDMYDGKPDKPIN